MTPTFPLRFDGGSTATGVRCARPGDLADALIAVGLVPPQRVIVVVGGAGGLDDRDTQHLRPLFADGLVAAAARSGAVTVDGGTRSGVMQLLGDAHHAAAATTPLVGVAAEGTVTLPGGGPRPPGAASLEPHHTHFVLVPGDDWGTETAWIADVATTLARGVPSATVLVNGGDIAYDDVDRSITAGRPVLTIAGSGRTADQLAAALRGDPADPRADALVASGLVRAAPMDDPARLDRALTGLLEAARQ